MDENRLNAWTHKARQGELNKNEQTELIREYRELQERLRQTEVTVGACIVQYGKLRADVPDGTHLGLFLAETSYDRARQAAERWQSERDNARKGHVLNYVVLPAK